MSKKGTSLFYRKLSWLCQFATSKIQARWGWILECRNELYTCSLYNPKVVTQVHETWEKHYLHTLHSRHGLTKQKKADSNLSFRFLSSSVTLWKNGNNHKMQRGYGNCSLRSSNLRVASQESQQTAQRFCTHRN